MIGFFLISCRDFSLLLSIFKHEIFNIELNLAYTTSIDKYFIYHKVYNMFSTKKGDLT